MIETLDRSQLGRPRGHDSKQRRQENCDNYPPYHFRVLAASSTHFLSIAWTASAFVEDFVCVGVFRSTILIDLVLLCKDTQASQNKNENKEMKNEEQVTVYQPGVISSDVVRSLRRWNRQQK